MNKERNMKVLFKKLCGKKLKNKNGNEKGDEMVSGWVKTGTNNVNRKAFKENYENETCNCNKETITMKKREKIMKREL